MVTIFGSYYRTSFFRGDKSPIEIILVLIKGLGLGIGLRLGLGLGLGNRYFPMRPSPLKDICMLFG